MGAFPTPRNSPLIRDGALLSGSNLFLFTVNPWGTRQAASGSPLKNLATEFVSRPNPSKATGIVENVRSALCSLIETSFLSSQGLYEDFLFWVKFWLDPFKGEQRTGQPGTKRSGTRAPSGEEMRKYRWATQRPTGLRSTEQRAQGASDVH